MSAASAVDVAPSPWNAKQRLVLLVLLALGVVGLIAGYVGTSGTLRVSRQVAWLNVGGAALLVSGAGVVVFLTAGRREIGRRRLNLFGDVVDDGPSAGALVPGTTSAVELVAADTMTRYHRADCSFVEGKTVVAATAAGHEQAGRRPCGVCLGGDEG